MKDEVINSEYLRTQRIIEQINEKIREKERLSQIRKNQEKIWSDYQSAIFNKQQLERRLWRTLSGKKRHEILMRIKALRNNIKNFESKNFKQPKEVTYEQQQRRAAEGTAIRADLLRQQRKMEELKIMARQVARIKNDIFKNGMDAGEAMFNAEQRVNSDKLHTYLKKLNPKTFEKLMKRRDQFVLREHYKREVHIALEKGYAIPKSSIKHFMENKKEIHTLSAKGQETVKKEIKRIQMEKMQQRQKTNRKETVKMFDKMRQKDQTKSHTKTKPKDRGIER